MQVVSGLALRRFGSTWKALMGLRKPTKKRPNMWEYPGGKVDPGETPTAALEREWHEELGVDVVVDERPMISVDMSIEVPCTLTLYLVRIPTIYTPRPLDHAMIDWIEPMHAIQWVPCTPSTYLVHRCVMNTIEALTALGDG